MDGAQHNKTDDNEINQTENLADSTLILDDHHREGLATQREN